MLNKISTLILTVAMTFCISTATTASVLVSPTSVHSYVQFTGQVPSGVIDHTNKITKKQKTNHFVSKVLNKGYFKRRYESGIASYYGTEWQGSKTASGIPFNTYALTAAHKHLPFGTHVLVKNLENGRSVIVKITDRGPFVVGRVIDLSLAAKRALGMGGTQMVALYIIP